MISSGSQMVRKHLETYGIKDAYFTHVVKCKPRKGEKPEREHLAACRPYLQEEIEQRDPKAILLLGANAMKSLIGKTSITEMNGQVVEKDGRKYVCAFSPAFLFRDPSKEGQFRMALGRYAAVLNGTFDPEMPTWRVIDKESIDLFLQDYHLCEEFSFDLETSGLEWWKDGEYINCISFSLLLRTGRESNWVLPIAKARIMPEDAVAELVRYLVDRQGRKRAVGQNAKFDNLWLLKHYGCRFYLDFDTMLAHHIIDENSNHGLKSLAREFCGAPDYDISTREKKGIGVPARRLFAYGAADAAYTRRLRSMFAGLMDEDDTWIFDNITMPAARAFEEIEANGLYVDVERMAQVQADEERILAECEMNLNQIVGRKINWNASAQVAEALYGDLGLTPTVFTDKGAPSTAEAALVGLNHPIGKALEEYRKHAKFLSTYIYGWQEFMDGPHLYLGTKIHGTVTGRFSSRLHQVPRDGTIRNLVIAPPGWTFVQMDLSQAELRVIAIVSKDPAMLECFRVGRDIHWNTLLDAIRDGGGEYVPHALDTAEKLSGEPQDLRDAIETLRATHHDRAIEIWKGWKEGRKKAKGINFGFSYGQSAEGFIDYATVQYGFTPTLPESTTFRNAFFSTYNRLLAWHDRQKRLARADGLVRNLIGRKRHLPGIHSVERQVVAECERQSINAPIQGFIGDYKTMILLELHEYFGRDVLRVVGEVHDSILMWVRTSTLDQTLRQAKRLAEAPSRAKEAGLNFPIPLTVDIEVGPWGAGKTWKGA